MGNKHYESVIKKKRKKHDKIVSLAKTKLDTIEVLISKALINSYIDHDKFVSVNVLREYSNMKEEIKNPKIAVEYTILKQWKPVKCRIIVSEELDKTEYCLYQILLFMVKKIKVH